MSKIENNPDTGVKAHSGTIDKLAGMRLLQRCKDSGMLPENIQMVREILKNFDNKALPGSSLSPEELAIAIREEEIRNALEKGW